MRAEAGDKLHLSLGPRATAREASSIPAPCDWRATGRDISASGHVGFQSQLGSIGASPLSSTTPPVSAFQSQLGSIGAKWPGG